MRSRTVWLAGILVLTFTLIPAVSFTAEHGGAGTAEHGGATTAGSSSAGKTASTMTPGQAGTATAPAQAPVQPGPEAATPAPAAPAPQAPPPAPVPPALKPIVITFSGDLASIDSTATPAMITVKDRYGVTKEISVPAEAKITQGMEAKTLGDLKAGETKLTIEYTYDVGSGKRTAQSITIGEVTVPASR